MKKTFFFSAALFLAASLNLMADDIISTASILFSNCPKGAINGAAVFTINAQGKQVYFAKGNLQYQPSTGTWRFAEHQQDFVGNVPANVNPLATQSEWIDLFRWGASGYDPNVTPITRGQGTPSNTYTGAADIAGTNYDWGKYNAISNGGNVAGQWRTLTKDEWDYIRSQRTEGDGYLPVCITIGSNTYRGYLFKPDNYTGPSDVKITMSGATYAYQCTEEKWKQLEAAGCLFMPACGSIYYYTATSESYYTSTNYSSAPYWVSTAITTTATWPNNWKGYCDQCYSLWLNVIDAQASSSVSYTGRYQCMPVRLAQDK